jgi:soluble lytic murein transglycosylase-like protein
MSLSAEETKALNNVATKLNVDPKYLTALIDFESGWNPKAHNPNSSARGLLQFIDSTAQSLGFISSLDLVNKNPDRVSQLNGPVYKYLKQFAPFKTSQALFMAVFYPKAMNWPATQAFPDTVRSKNPGINTPADYVKHVFSRLNVDFVEKTATISLTGILILFLIGKQIFKG